MKIISKETFAHPLVLSAVGLVVVIAIGSALYYISATSAPRTSLSASNATTTSALTATGTVEPAQNPNIAFQSGGRVASVSVAVGTNVYAGEVLASLDTASLAAQRAGAVAALASQEAHLAQLQAGPRSVDVAAKQTAVDQANASLQNTYIDAATAMLQAYDKALSGIGSNTDVLFNQPNSASPSLIFSTINNQDTINAVNARSSAEAALASWNTETGALPGATPSQLEAELAVSLSHLTVLSAYTDALLLALNNAAPSSTFSSASVSSYQASLQALQGSLNTLTTSLQSEQQQITSAKLAVTEAEDALNQTTAAATPEDIQAQEAEVEAAQAQVDAADAQIQNAIVVAPFAGTVASVQVKVGDSVAPDTVAVSLNPKSALQIVAYFSEIDIAKIKAGAPAEITLDAYGSGQVFPAEVVSVDSAPSPTSNAQGAPTGYKATLQFLHTDPAISSGMSANITIPLQ
jgi:HlyD family secretion protein